MRTGKRKLYGSPVVCSCMAWAQSVKQRFIADALSGQYSETMPDVSSKSNFAQWES